MVILPDEHTEQVALVRKLRSKGLFVFAVPNGGLRDAITSKRLKDEGATSGIPDLCLVMPEGGMIWIELKRRKGGTVSKVQKEIHARLEALGHTVIIGYGAKDAFDKLGEYID
tara:strand:- start:152 stop:490 length:339 start_codon:yes stop_codon:yes gene_type:complete